MKKVLSIVVLVVMAYIGVAIIEVIFQFLSGLDFSIVGFLAGDGMHIFWVVIFMFLIWLVRFVVELIIHTSQKISFSENGMRYIVTGVSIVILHLIALIGSLLSEETRSLSQAVMLIAVIIYGGLFVYYVNNGEYKHF